MGLSIEKPALFLLKSWNKIIRINVLSRIKIAYYHATFLMVVYPAQIRCLKNDKNFGKYHFWLFSEAKKVSNTASYESAIDRIKNVCNDIFRRHQRWKLCAISVASHKINLINIIYLRQNHSKKISRDQWRKVFQHFLFFLLGFYRPSIRLLLAKLHTHVRSRNIDCWVNYLANSSRWFLISTNMLRLRDSVNDSIVNFVWTTFIAIHLSMSLWDSSPQIK